MHQLALTAVHDDDEGRWLSLVNRPDEIACFHFSAIPKPSNLLLGDITLESCGWLWKDFREHAEWYTDDDNDLKDRATTMATQIFEYNKIKSNRSAQPNEEKKQKLACSSPLMRHMGYINEWFDNCSPNLVHIDYQQLMVQAFQ